MLDWWNAQDPLVRQIAYAALALVVIAIVLRQVARRRAARAAASRQAELRRDYEAVRLHQEEIKKLADQILTTSSTARVTGFTIVRQVEAVFTDGCASSQAALELAKALAARKGANALINLQTQQTALGKWVAGGDAVVVKNLARAGEGKRAGEP